jgi:hypothetical protein
MSLLNLRKITQNTFNLIPRLPNREDSPELVDLSVYDNLFNYHSHKRVTYSNSILYNLEKVALDYSNEEIKATLQSYDTFTLPVSCTDLISGDSSYVIKLVEDVLILVRDLYRSESKSDYILSIVTFTKLRSTKPFSQLLVEQWDRLMGTVLQSGDKTAFSSLRDLLDNYPRIKVLPIFQKLYKFIMYCIGTSLFDKLGLKFNLSRFIKIEKAAIKKEYFMGPDFIHCLLDTSLFLCETGYQCMVTGSLDPIFHHETSYEKWLKDSELLKLQSRFISNPEPHGFTVFDFLNRIDGCIEKGTSIVKYHSKDEAGGKICKYLLNELKVIRAECLTKRLAQQDRKAPFAVLVSGGSSVGKSTFTKLLYYHFGKLFKLPTEAEYRFVQNPFDKHWNNFNSSQWCVQLDDIAFLHPNSAQGCDPSLMEMLQVVNNVPYVPAQADLADKGKTPLRARFVVATTNTEHLNAEAYFSCPLAVQRRLPYVINLFPKQEYLRDLYMLDTGALPEIAEGEYPDFWRIVVKKVIPMTKPNTHMGQSSELKEIQIFDDILEFIKWFNGIAKEADQVQDKSMSCDLNMSKCTLCDCGIPIVSCKEHKVVLQTGEMVVYNTPWIEEMNRRHNLLDEDQEHQDPGYKYMYKGIMKEISSMSICTRVIVFWYYCLMYIIHTMPWGRCVVAFIFGRWYFYLLLCRMMHIPEMRHIACYLLGYKAYRGICRNKQAIIVCAAITTAVTMYKTYSFLSNFKASPGEPQNKDIPIVATLQGSSSDRGVSPEPKGDKLENVWYKDVYECTPFDVTPSTLSKCNWTLDDAEKLIINNCVFIIIRAQSLLEDGQYMVHEKRTKAVCIGGQMYMLNNHAVPFPEFELEIIMQNKKDGVTTNNKYLITPIQYSRIPEKDIILIKLPVPPKRDIRHLFARKSYAGRFNGRYIGRNIDGSVYRNDIYAPTLTPNYRHVDPKLMCDIVCDMWVAHPATPTLYGDCGALMLVKSNLGPIILGMHVLGTNIGGCLAIAIDFEFLDEYEIGMTNSNPTLQVGEYSQTLVDLNRKSTVRYLETGVAQVFGSFSGFRGKMKSRVRPTLMSDLAVEHGYKRDTAPPVMNSWVPWNKALIDMTRPVTLINVTILEICKQTFCNEILDGLSPEDLAEVQVYDNLTAINGKPGLAYVDKLNRNTSAGFPFRKSKKFFLNALEPIDEMQHPVEVTPEILKEMDKIIDTYESKKVYCPVFTASLKDEPVSKKKAKEGKTRVFCGAPMPWTLVVRKYLLSVIRLIQKNRILFEAGPGTIAQSDEWDKIYKYLVAFGVAKIIAGDYEKFDKRMPAIVIDNAFDILIQICEKAGFTAKDLCVLWGISSDTSFPTVDFKGDLMRFYGTNPSGHPLTVIINGLANSLYLRYCYFVLNPAKTVVDFKANVHVFTYGDDVIMGVSDNVPWFNHSTIQFVLASIDIGFTMADKEAPSVPYIHIDDATFLKRSWRYEPELEKYVCPIEHSSIDKMLTMCVESKTICMELQAVAVLDTVVREYFWYGKEIFEEKRKLMNLFIDQLSLSMYCEKPLPTWCQLIDEYRHNCSLRN